MSDVIDALRTLYRTTGHPPRILIRGETAPQAVTRARDRGYGAAGLMLADGREIIVYAYQVWCGVYVAPDVVQTRATDADGRGIEIRMLDTEMIADRVTLVRGH